MNTKSKIQPAILTLLLLSILLPMFVRGATNQTIYQTGFEPPVFTPGLPIRGQDNWEMFHDGEAISVSTNNARSGMQCLRMDGALLEQTGPNSSAAFCFSKVFLDNPSITPPPIVELTAYVRLDGPQTGTDGASTNDLMSANFAAVADAGGSAVELGSFLVSCAGRIFTWGSRPEDRYKYSAPMTFGAYQKLVLRVDFIARTVRYFANDVELGFVPFASSITSDRLAGGYLVMAGPVEPLITPYHYDPADYTAYFDDYSIVSVPPSPVDAVIEFASTNVLTDEFRPTASVLVIRRGFTNAAVRVTVSTTNGTAMANEDYEATTTFVTFAAGETNRMVEIPLHDDYWAEPDKTFLVRLMDLPPGVTSGGPQANVFIRDDERPGSIDHSWTSDLGLPPLAPGQFVGRRLIVQADGKILTMIFRASPPFFVPLDERVVRINGDGTLDATFTPIVTQFGNGVNFFLMPNGKSVIAQAAVPLGNNKRLRRFNPDGTPDNTLTATITGSAPGPWVVGLPNGKMLLLGSVRYSGEQNRVNGAAVANLVRLNQDGSLDGTFAAPAGLEFNVLNYDPPVLVLPNGKILVGTESTRPVYLLNENGSTDAGFAVITATLDPALNPYPVVSSLLVQSDGRIVVGGAFDTFNGRAQNGIVRLHTNGVIDPTFQSGTGLGPPGGVSGLNLLSDGRIFVEGGPSYNGESVVGQFLLHADGRRDSAFAVALVPPLSPLFGSDPVPAWVGAVASGQPIFSNGARLGRLRMDLPLRIVSLTRDGNGASRIVANALAGRSYTLQSSDTLSNWTDLATQTTPTNRVEFTDAPALPPTQRFHRVKQN